ncbi:RNA methyltransferase [Shewanella mangrovi]|uniref:tRNA (cytidine/uridine-2'-O-)-methyltransferase TrmJ n=1 Tax=Shewanella mangrovi TaxID=1515746 RepID=A0A094JK76_9GAMM|nr:tRNA/rRNA methyltransferase [Shewanella mangrovi]KFZ38464.1 RNA methyltransferase [Shewanella mangrovi]
MPISFILVQPSRAANVGAAARALKTQGFAELIVVDSEAHQQEEASWVACGAEDVLQGIRSVPSLSSLRAEFDLLVGTTARERSNPRSYHSPEQLYQILQAQPNTAKVAVVFGCESSGLSNTDLAMCDLLSYIPLAVEYPSLNLAQAVMVYAYELGAKRDEQLSQPIGLVAMDADAQQTQALKQKALLMMKQLGNAGDEKLQQWLMDGIASLSERDMKLAHQLIGDVLKKFDA